MHVRRISIQNYKSLRNVHVTPRPLSVFVGPNGAGKSNFASALDFLSNVYEHGLEVAVARKGGFENIAFRRKRRSTLPIQFEVEIGLSDEEVERSFFRSFRFKELRPLRLTLSLKHKFSFRAESQAIGAGFTIESEEFELYARYAQEEDEKWALQGRFVRGRGGKISTHIPRAQSVVQAFRAYFENRKEVFGRFEEPIGNQSLYVGGFPVYNVFFHRFADSLENFRVFQFAPLVARGPGVPTPNPTLSVTGDNLPALVSWLRSNYPELWSIVLDAMRDLVPGITDITVDFVHTKTLALFIHDQRVGRPWTADDVSDGTIRTLAILLAAVDPRTSGLMLEELEISIHPWMIKTLLERLRDTSAAKSVMLTTHSPILVDMLRPSELFVVFKRENKSHISALTDLDSHLEEMWEAGDIRLSEYLDSGLLPQAVPGGVEL